MTLPDTEVMRRTYGHIKRASYEAARIIGEFAATSPEYEGEDGMLACNYCPGNDPGDDDDWEHAESCPWIAAVRFVE